MSNLDKRLYKIELYLLKILPMLMALLYLMNTVLSYFHIKLSIFSYIAGMSFLPLLFIYMSSYVFKFCEYHRMFLHYIVINNAINMYDYYYRIPVSNKGLLSIHLVVTGIMLFLILYMHVKSNKESTIKSS